MPEIKSVIIPIRVTPAQAEEFKKGAEQDGRRLSEWLRELARRELKKQVA